MALPGGIKHVEELPVEGKRVFVRVDYNGANMLAGSTMFLVPNTWNPHDTTLVLPVDSLTRLQFQFRNLAP